MDEAPILTRESAFSLTGRTKDRLDAVTDTCYG